MQSGRWFGSPFLLTLHCADATLREGAQCLERALRLHQASPMHGAMTSWGRGSALSWEKGRTWEKKAAQVLKNIQIGCARLAGSGRSSEGQDSPLKWGDELQP